MKHGKPTTTAAATATGNPRGPGPVASVAERLVVALKPGNAGGAKGPQFKDQRTQEQGQDDWRRAYQHRSVAETPRGAA